MMMKRIAIVLIAAHASLAGATGLNGLENFVAAVKTGRAEFTQVVTSPAKDGQAPRVKTSSGSFEFARPNRFKFVYKKPFEQSIVADGHTLWLYDVDLNQVTSRAQAASLGATPAALIASAPDLKALQAHFTLADAPDKDGLAWVQATPKAKDGQLQSIRMGFKLADAGGGASGGLRVLEILDNFAQRSVLTFTHFEVNPMLSAQAFEFKPPKGADVVRQ